MEKLEDRFYRLFRGSDRAHGVYTTGGTGSSGKVSGRAMTHLQPPSTALWHDHLKGKQGIGVIPIMSDNHCFFGAGDIDTYPLDLTMLEESVTENDFPLVVCRTKSGGAHCYLFTSEPVPAELMRTKLTEMMLALGFASVEIFPKQIQLASAEDVGNWINMPYFDGERTTRYAMKDGNSLTPEQFLDYAEGKRLTKEQLEAVSPKTVEAFDDAPPCLQIMARNGIDEGQRNEAMFSFGVYAKKKFGDTWEKELDNINVRYVSPPLNSQEVVGITRQLAKKDYFYKCSQDPCSKYCNKEICRQREYGIGDGDGGDIGVILDGMVKHDTDPPVWYLSINGVRLQLNSDDLTIQARFHKKCVEKVSHLPNPVKPMKWRRVINELLLNQQVVEAPEDASTTGQFLYHLEQFCTSKAQAKARDELLVGKPWTSEGRVHFRSNDLLAYLDQQKFKEYRQNTVWSVLREMCKAKHHTFHVKGKCVQCWSIPEFMKQSEDFDVPRAEDIQF